MKSSVLTTQAIFDRYQSVRSRLPTTGESPKTVDIHSLLDIADRLDAFVFDAFGVLNVGDTLIEGADRRLSELRRSGCAIRILTNAASYDRSGAIEKFRRLGLDVLPNEIITSREATLNFVDDRHWGVIAAQEDALTDLPGTVTRLANDPNAYDAVDGFLFLSTSGWTDDRQDLLETSMGRRRRPLLIANADIAAPRDDGFSLEPGYFGHLIADRFADQVRFFGKPFPEIYEIAETTLPGIPPHRIAMCGDTLHTDIIGASSRGWKTVLVARDGLFAGHDTTPFSKRSGLFANWRVQRI